VFFIKAKTANLDQSDASARARAAAQAAAQHAATAAKSTAAGLGNGLQQGVYTARRWTAPRLESAAEYCTTTVAPSVAAALRNTAKQVSPAEPARSTRRRILTWSLLGTAILATAGAAIALVRYQFRAATPEESEEIGETGTDVSGMSTAPAAGTTAATTPTPTPNGPVIPAAQPSPSGAGASAHKTAAHKTATTTDTSVNGHVSSNEW
jgi:hypothetical protein